MDLKHVFEQIQAAEKAGNLTPEEKRKLEEQAAEKGLQALFKVCSPCVLRSHTATLTEQCVGDKAGDRVCAARDV